MQFLHPSSDRNAITIWYGVDDKTGCPLRITRTIDIDIDGDEHWITCLQRNGVWTHIPYLCGRNIETASKLRHRFQVTLYETEPVPFYEGDDFGGTRTLLNVSPGHADDAPAGFVTLDYLCRRGEA